MPHRRFRRGVYLFPTLFTVGNLLCGFSSILHASIGEKFRLAALLIVIAGILDGLDGRLARMTGTASAFGKEFDSLADVVSFGVAPAFLIWRWTFDPTDRIGWLVAFLYVVCTAMRLARFNIRSADGSKKYFAGLPTPMAAGLLACFVYTFPLAPNENWAPTSMAIMVVIASGLMISKIRYRSFKDLDLRNRRSYVYVLFIAAILAAVVAYPHFALLLLATGYALSGPLGSVWRGIGRLTGRATRVDEVADESTTH